MIASVTSDLHADARFVRVVGNPQLSRNGSIERAKSTVLTFTAWQKRASD